MTQLLSDLFYGSDLLLHRSWCGYSREGRRDRIGNVASIDTLAVEISFCVEHVSFQANGRGWLRERDYGSPICPTMATMERLHLGVAGALATGGFADLDPCTTSAPTLSHTAHSLTLPYEGLCGDSVALFPAGSGAGASRLSTGNAAEELMLIACTDSAR